MIRTPLFGVGADFTPNICTVLKYIVGPVIKTMEGPQESLVVL